MNIFGTTSSNYHPLTLVSGLIFFGVLAVLMGLSTLRNSYRQGGRAKDPDVNNPLDTSFLTRLKRTQVATSNTRFLLYLGAFSVGAGLICVIAGGIIELAR
jgi:hypothetical protein